MMRNGITYAALALAGALLATPAVAQERWSHDSGRLTFEAPAGWPVDVMSREGETVLDVAAGDAAKECRIYAMPRADSAGYSIDAVLRSYATPLTAETWTQVASQFRIFEGDATYVSSEIDTSGFWPIQTATFRTQGRMVYGMVQGRPGTELYGFCTTYDGPDQAAAFQGLLRSVGTAEDAAWQAQAAPQPAPAPAP